MAGNRVDKLNDQPTLLNVGVVVVECSLSSSLPLVGSFLPSGFSLLGTSHLSLVSLKQLVNLPTCVENASLEREDQTHEDGDENTNNASALQ